MSKKVNKPFDYKLYNKYDKKAITYAKNILTTIELKGIDNPRKTGVDLFATKNGETIFYVECEINKGFFEGKFIYEKIHIPERKKKFLGLKYPTLFMIFAPDGNGYLCFWDALVSEFKLEAVDNKLVKNNEYFFRIPKELVFDNINNAVQI